MVNPAAAAQSPGTDDWGWASADPTASSADAVEAENRALPPPPPYALSQTASAVAVRPPGSSSPGLSSATQDTSDASDTLTALAALAELAALAGTLDPLSTSSSPSTSCAAAPHRKRRHEDRSPDPTTGTLNLVPLLRQLNAVPPGAEAHPQHAQILASLADDVARSAVIYLRADDECWHLADQTRQRLETLLSQDPLRGTRPAGVQFALNQFNAQWNALLGERHLPNEPLLMQKVVPLDADLIQASGHVLPITVGAQHPRRPVLLARTTGLSAGGCNVRNSSFAKPLLSLVSVPGGLRLSIGPRTPDETGVGRSSGLRPEDAARRCEQALKDNGARGGDLSQAVAQYNRDVPAALRLQLQADLSDGLELIPLQPGQCSSSDRVMWFNYRLLAAPSGLDDAIQDRGMRDLLNRCRTLARRDVHAVSLTSAQMPLPVGAYRRDIVSGCAVQLRLEESQRLMPEQARQIRFSIPVCAIMDQLPLTERRMVERLSQRLSADGQRGSGVPSAGVEGPGLQPTYVQERTGHPIGCLMLTSPAAAAPLRSETAARRPAAATSQSETAALRSATAATALPPTQAVAIDPDVLFAADAMYNELVDLLVVELATPGQWGLFSSKLPPRMLQGCSGWPLGRPLEVVQADTLAVPVEGGGPRDTWSSPVRIVQTPGTELYAGLQDGHLIEVPPDGDSFFTAVLAALSDAERRTLLRECGCDAQHMGSIPHAVSALRRHFAQYFSQHRMECREFVSSIYNMI